jgi:hypothetical protein
VSGRDGGARDRRNIHSQVAAAMLARERPGSIDIRFRQETFAGRVATTSLRYAFEGPPQPAREV